ncbi:hypothetical protein SOVF_056690, partial [Spinacia oleracea]
MLVGELEGATAVHGGSDGAVVTA